jgi:hypothetical protein
MQVVFNPAPNNPTHGLGHLAAARHLIRLNAVSPALFPLPHALAREVAGANEDIELPDEDTDENDDTAAPASEENGQQKVHVAAGTMQAVLDGGSELKWTELDTMQPLDPGG